MLRHLIARSKTGAVMLIDLDRVISADVSADGKKVRVNMEGGHFHEIGDDRGTAVGEALVAEFSENAIVLDPPVVSEEKPFLDMPLPPSTVTSAPPIPGARSIPGAR